jgi:hypothetical protein
LRSPGTTAARGVAHRLARDPLLVLRGERRSQVSGYEVLGMWREHAETVSGHAVKSGHFLPDEAAQCTNYHRATPLSQSRGRVPAEFSSLVSS